MEKQKVLVDKKKLREKLKAEPERAPSWDWKTNKELFGEVTELKSVDFSDGERQLALIKNDDDNEVYAVWLGTVLKSQFKEQNIMIGDVVGIEYLGKVKNYQNFRVAKQ